MKQLHNAQDAIEQAIEGGWRKGIEIDYHFVKHGFVEVIGIKNQEDDDITERDKLTLEEIFCDSFFWQALGKARGWNPYVEATITKKGTHWGWIHWAELWFENRMVGGDENKFWQSLL